MKNIFFKIIIIVSAYFTANVYADKRPNILLVVVDDVGYTDLGAFGGEIKTPTLDGLARAGLRFTQFYVAPTCSPTRAMLLSGADSHIAGLGNMAEELAPNQIGQPGYEGYLNDRVVSVASLLQGSGYATFMSGKWHLGLTEAQSPKARGFDKSYALLQGGAGHLDQLALVGPGTARYRENGQDVNLPSNFYSTQFFTDKTITYIKDSFNAKEARKPFFAYLAFSAPHWPLQAPKASIARYKDRYNMGYEQLAKSRQQMAEKEGVVRKGLQPWQGPVGEKAWHELSVEERKVEAKKMEIYAAMVDDIDMNIGRLINYLKDIKEWENTWLIFLSDNGPEGHHLEQGWPELQNWVETCCDNSYNNMGAANSYLWLGPQWAAAATGGRHYFKGYVGEGGIRVPAFIYKAGMPRGASINSEPLSVKDIAPTLLSIAGAVPPVDKYNGRNISSMDGESMLPYLLSETETVHAADYFLGWELFGKTAIRQGDWKITKQPFPAGTGQWRLYNLQQDPIEARDLSLKNPKKLNKMKALWENYARQNGVILPNKVSGY